MSKTKLPPPNDTQPIEGPGGVMGLVILTLAAIALTMFILLILNDKL